MIEELRTYYPLACLRAVLALVENKVFKNYPEVAVRVQAIDFPVRIRVQTSDLLVVKQVLLDGKYESPIAVRPGVIVDGGANIGVTSIFYANRYPAARIFAIEPELSNFRMLVKNVAPYKSITPILGALWNKNRPLAVSSVKESAHWGVRVSEAESPTVTPAFTMADLMQRYNIGFIDILKLDIEGAEKEVFETSESWIGKVGMMAVETHDRLRSGCSEAFEVAAAAFPKRFTQGEITFAIRAQEAGEAH